jgi:hypothetical protein
MRKLTIHDGEVFLEDEEVWIVQHRKDIVLNLEEARRLLAWLKRALGEEEDSR